MSWYAKGGGKEVEQFKNESPNQKTLFRFWLNKGEKKEIVFLADEMFAVWEHTIPMGNNKYEQFTCSRDANCRFCGEKKNATFTLYCSVLDMTPYTAKDGSVKKYSKRAFPAKGAAIEVLSRRRQEAGGNLTGYKVNCFRDGDKAPNCGNDFTLIQKVDLTKLPADVAKPFDFETMLAPLPSHVVDARLKFGGGGVQTRDRDDLSDPFSEGSPAPKAGSTPAVTDDDIPF